THAVRTSGRAPGAEAGSDDRAVPNDRARLNRLSPIPSRGTRRVARLVHLDEGLPKIPADNVPRCRLPSPSRHIYNSLTIIVAFRRLGAFDWARQRPIKVDGTFV